MCTYYFTCGQSHSHDSGGGKIWNKNSVLQVNAPNREMATAKVIRLFGMQWGDCYGPDDIGLEHYPGGICNVITVSGKRKQSYGYPQRRYEK